MKLNSSNMLFYYTLILGMLTTISSNNWMMMWAGLEISLMSFIPLMSGGIKGSESSMKYFIIQSMSSSLLMLSILLMMVKLNYNYMICVSLLIKMGVAPMHNWILSIVNGLDYISLFMLLTIMKIGPLTLLSYINQNIELFIMTSLIFGSILGLNQNSIRKVMSYSSIYNMGYIISVINKNMIWFLYLMMYSVVLMMIILLLKKLKINYLNQFMINDMSLESKMSMWISMLSLGGMPPFLGFFPKLMIIQMMLTNNMIFIVVLMILSSLVVMFFYIRMMFVMLISYSMMMKWNLLKVNKISFIYMSMNIFMFPVMVLTKSLT
nr:NADH dehydrogenase subunit 2 [Ujna puerana]